MVWSDPTLRRHLEGDAVGAHDLIAKPVAVLGHIVNFALGVRTEPLEVVVPPEAARIDGLANHLQRTAVVPLSGPHVLCGDPGG